MENSIIRKIIYTVIVAGIGMMLLSSCEKKSGDIPTSPVTLEGLIEEGWTYYANRDFEQAIEKFNGALERDVDPDQALSAYQGLGWSYSRVNKYSLSISNFNFLLSVESVRSGKNPIVELEKVTAVSNPIPEDPNIAVLSGLGIWTIETVKYILSISGIESYSAQLNHKFGSPPSFEIERGTRSLKLDKALISDTDGEEVGTSLSSSLRFSVSENADPSYPEADSLVYPVVDVSEIDTTYTYDLTQVDSTLSQYHLDVITGIVTIKPRYWPMNNLEATYKYYEKAYQIRQFGYHLISLNDKLEDGSSLPILDKENYEGGDKYLIAGEFFNTSDGGTYYQADAFAGMAASYIEQGDYENAIRATRAAIFINEYLKDNDPDNYPYERNLYEGDIGFDMWNIYFLLTVSYFNLKEYHNAEVCLEDYMSQGDILDPTSATYEYDMIKLLDSIQRPGDWQPPQIW